MKKQVNYEFIQPEPYVTEDGHLITPPCLINIVSISYT